MANRNQKLRQVFSTNTQGIADMPEKISGVRVARILHTDERGGCSFCFPHGPETTNAAQKNKRRSWKNHRKNRWKA